MVFCYLFKGALCFQVLALGCYAGADLGGGCRGCAPLPEMTYGFLIQLVLYKKMWFIGVTQLRHFLVDASPPKKKILDPPLLRNTSAVRGVV